MSQENFYDSNYSPSCSIEVNFTQDYGVAGSINREESDLEEVDLQDTPVNLSLSSPELTPLRVYLRLTFLWYPSKASFLEKLFCTVMQLIILLGLICIYLYSLGTFGNKSVDEEEFKEPVTTVKNFIWSSRTVEMYILGMWYFFTRHLESVLQEVNLTERHWRKAKKTIKRIHLAVIMLVFVFPLTSNAVQMMLHSSKEDEFKPKTIVLSLLFSCLARIFSLPIVFVFFHVMCIILSDIDKFKHQIKKWPSNEKEEARNRFIDIKVMIRKAQSSFQPFLVTHLILLLVLLLPSIFSVAERFQNESSYQETLADLKKVQAASKGNFVKSGEVIFVNSSSLYNTGEVALILRLPPKALNTSERVWSQGSSQGEKTRTVQETSWRGVVKVVFSGLSDFLEMFILYSFPLVLLTRIHNAMRSLPEVVQNLKFSEQRAEGFLFQSRETLKEMLKELSSGSGIKILRMNLTGVKAALITLLMPFLTTAFNLLFLDIHLKKSK